MTKAPKKIRHRPTKESKVIVSLMPGLPLIDGEQEDDYTALQDNCLKAVGPKNAIERIWLQDVIDYSWEAIRLRRAKAALIQIARKAAVELLLTECLGGDYRAKKNAASLTQGWSIKDAEDVETVHKLLEEHGYNTDAIMALAITIKLGDLERIDKLIASYNTRRDAALRELEKRRDILAGRAREFTENTIIDAEVEILVAAE
jgi:hypothetical protein